MPNTLMRATRPGNELYLDDANTAPFQVRSKQSLIQWPKEREIRRVSGQLARIQRVGIRSEANGDYFKRGDLAYQIQEIIRATADLARKSARVKR